MKTLIIITTALVLAGCSARFDNAEYSRLVDMKMMADPAVCADDDTAHSVARNLSYSSGWLVEYSTHLPRNTPTLEMVTALHSTTTAFEHRYEVSRPSETFCTLQFEIIGNQLSIILNASGGKFR